MIRLAIALLVVVLVLAGCGDDGQGDATPAPGGGSPTATGARTSTQPATPSASANAPAASIRPIPSTSGGPADQPLGFPIDPMMKLGLVTGAPGSRTIEWGSGEDALTYSRDDQPSDDPERASRSGWNCRVHREYEGIAVVDWYIPSGTPVYATLDGLATLYAITTANAFDYYGVIREPYLGNPERARAPLSPFPGPSGGLGVYVEIDSGSFVAAYGHLDLRQTTQVIRPSAFLEPYTPADDYSSLFGEPDAPRPTPIAQWQVRRGDIVGMSGDSGYSEAPHLHYTIQRAGSQLLLCPTTEAGFPENGWLFR